MTSPLPALVFIGLVAFQPLDLAGPVGLRVNVGTTGPSMHLHAKLADVAPDGSARMLVRGQEYLADPDLGRAVGIRLRHTGYRLQPGHRLRVHLACSDYPLYLWHPGTQANPVARRARPAERAVTRDRRLGTLPLEHHRARGQMAARYQQD